MYNLILIGLGKMGQEIINYCRNNNDKYKIIAGFDKNLIAYDFFTTNNFDTLKTHIINKTESKPIVVDFSNAQLTDDVLLFCTQNNLPLVLCTTGQSSNILNNIHLASNYIPIIQSTNTSYGVFLLNKIISYLNYHLNNFDVVISEVHHKNKKDSPSGTAKTIYDNIVKYNNKVDIQCIRAGSVFGEHTISLFSSGEQIHLSHIAESRQLFVLGTMECIRYISDKHPGLYTIDDVYNEKTM